MTHCDSEPITRLECIQSFGFLLAMSRDWIVVRASANLETFTGISAAAAIGQSIDALVDRRALHDIRNRLAGVAASGGTDRIYGVELIAGRARIDIAIHYVQELCLLEGEAAGGEQGIDVASMVRRAIARLNEQKSLKAFHADASRQIRTITGFERVMIYRFVGGGSGQVIAETLMPGNSSFLGLTYPAGDVPLQARALYVLNPFRVIADVNSAAVSILAGAADDAMPLDLSLAVTRAVSPIHLQYLRNMRVGASLSISIIIDGVLWGLIACHNRIPLLPNFAVRTAAELFGQMYSMNLERRLRQVDESDNRAGNEAINMVMKAIDADDNLLTNSGWLHDALHPIIPFDGLAVCLNGRASFHGTIPCKSGFAAMGAMLRSTPDGPLLATDDMATLKLGSFADVGDVAGMLCMSLYNAPGDYLMLFRREWLHHIHWAGRPEKASRTHDGGRETVPRKNFDLFTESIRGRARPFSATECRLAAVLRTGLSNALGVKTRGSLALASHVTERQELLIAELNHRVRNVLALIRGLITQTRGEQGDVASYVKSLNGQVKSLAKAQDRLTRRNWGPGPISVIFEDEIAAFVPGCRHRFRITGKHILLHPTAFSTMALVIHELITNSAKYGSLSQDGRVEVDLRHAVGEGLHFRWLECDGPVVREPTRRGFGSVILERLVPFDLQGTARMQYLPPGLLAEFHIPDRHIAPVQLPFFDAVQALVSAPSGKMLAASVAKPLEGLKVLLLEDNLIVALEAESLLTRLGAVTVYTVSTNAAALVLLAAEQPDFAVLDINLGVETSLTLGDRLYAERIPFIFASGYGKNMNLGSLRGLVLTLVKPYDQELLALAIAQAIDGAENREQPALL